MLFYYKVINHETAIEIISSRESLISSIRQHTNKKYIENTSFNNTPYQLNKDATTSLVSWIRENMKDYTIFDYGFKSVTITFNSTYREQRDNNYNSSSSGPRPCKYTGLVYITVPSMDEFIDFFNITGPKSNIVLCLDIYCESGETFHRIGPATLQTIKTMDKYHYLTCGKFSFSCYSDANSFANNSMQTSIDNFFRDICTSNKGIAVHREPYNKYKLMK